MTAKVLLIQAAIDGDIWASIQIVMPPIPGDPAYERHIARPLVNLRLRGRAFLPILGHSNKEIGSRLNLSVKTIEAHKANANQQHLLNLLCFFVVLEACWFTTINVNSCPLSQMNRPTKRLTETALQQRRIELLELSRQLREEHSQLREISKLLCSESKELSEESKMLRTSGHTLREVVDEFHCVLTAVR